jgi:hypothetical protein
VRTAFSNPGQFAPFDPRTETPIPGEHWDFDPRWADAATAALTTLPRTIRVAFGVRF